MRSKKKGKRLTLACVDQLWCCVDHVKLIKMRMLMQHTVAKVQIGICTCIPERVFLFTFVT